MKKTIYTFAFAIALASVSPANAIANSLVTVTGDNNNNETLKTFQKEACYLTIDGQEDCSNLQKPILDPIPLNSATVSSCPSGTTKSSDGCCCVNN